MSLNRRFETVELTCRADGVVFVRIDSPPVNAGSARVRKDLLDAFGSLSGRQGLRGIVLFGSNGNFVAGSDMREFDAPPVAPHLPDVIAAIETLDIPVVAAIEGAALGGGYELALGCDLRVAAANAVVGLPEVTLGLVPGAGGTVRLPRLVGVARAVDLITSGRRVKAQEALERGMIDVIAEGDVVEEAARLLHAGVAKRILRHADMPALNDTALEAAEAAAKKRARGLDAVREAITLIRSNLSSAAEDVLAAEREASLRLRLGRQSKALRHLFFAEREAARPPDGAQARDIGTIGVIGAGRMGAGIALAFATRGLDVRLADNNPGVLEGAKAYIAEQARLSTDKGRIPSAHAVIDRVRSVTVAEMGDCDLVVEAVIEDMDVKRAVFAELARVVDDTTILATNTSYLDVDVIAAAISRPERVAGLHFFNPAHLMKLVEVIEGARTSPDTVATLLKLCRRLGKVPVVAGVGEGFIGNRIFAAYRRQCEFLLEEGALPEEVDAAMRDFGMAMGPFEVFDMTGLDVAWAMRRRLASTRDPEARYVDIPDWLCEAGRFGRKTGKGWYDYCDGHPRPDPLVVTLIEKASAEKGLTRRAVPADEIRLRLLASMINEAAFVLEEGIAARPGDVDLVLVNGYGFPALKGGILHWAALEGRADILQAVEAMARASGKGARVAPNLEKILADAERL